METWEKLRDMQNRIRSNINLIRVNLSEGENRREKILKRQWNDVLFLIKVLIFR